LAIAQYGLGALYDEGVGVPQNYADAAKWYQKAADQGMAGTQYSLGILYIKGDGVPQNYVKAHMWLNLAAVGLEGDKENRNSAVTARDMVAKLMTPDQIAEAQKLASQWAPTK
jgi:TPR repeat protein